MNTPFKYYLLDQYESISHENHFKYLQPYLLNSRSYHRLKFWNFKMSRLNFDVTGDKEDNGGEGSVDPRGEEQLHGYSGIGLQVCKLLVWLAGAASLSCYWNFSSIQSYFWCQVRLGFCSRSSGCYCCLPNWPGLIHHHLLLLVSPSLITCD